MTTILPAAVRISIAYTVHGTCCISVLAKYRPMSDMYRQYYMVPHITQRLKALHIEETSDKVTLSSTVMYFDIRLKSGRCNCNRVGIGQASS